MSNEEFVLRRRRGSGASITSTTSLMPTSNIKEIGSRVGYLNFF